MANESKRRWRNVALSAVLLAVAGLVAPIAATAAQAAPEPGDSVFIGTKVGYSGTGIFPIWSETPATGEPDFWAYCIEHDVSPETNIEGQVGEPSSYLGSNYYVDPAIQGKVLWVLAHSYPALSLEDFGAATGATGISQNDAIEATQYAIWRYTDLNFDAPWAWETPDSETAYWYLVNGANASSGATPSVVTASVTAPAAAQIAGTLVGPFVVSTNQAVVSASVSPSLPITDASGNVIDAGSLVDGQEFYLDLRGSTTAGSATVTVSAMGSSGTGNVVSVPTTAGATPTVADHAQSIILVAGSSATTFDEASAQWAAQPAAAVPSIGTSLVDSADGDRVLPWNGGTVIDTVAYQNLTPGTTYTLTGELIRKSDGTTTGITATTTFTPTSASGSADVTFQIPQGYAGATLVAYERLFEGTTTTGTPAATHEDINDAAQTVTVENAPVVTPAKPATVTPAKSLANTGSVPLVGLAALALLGLAGGTVLKLSRRRA